VYLDGLLPLLLGLRVGVGCCERLRHYNISVVPDSARRFETLKGCVQARLLALLAVRNLHTRLVCVGVVIPAVDAAAFQEAPPIDGVLQEPVLGCAPCGSVLLHEHHHVQVFVRQGAAQSGQ
jgi:hypothetical protein